MSNKKRYKQFLLILCLVPLVVFTAWCGYRVYTDSNTRADLKDDFSKANSIEYGLLSVDTWKTELKKIISQQISDFDLSERQDSLLRVQISGVLNDLITQANEMVQEHDKGLKNKLRKLAVNTFVDMDELRDRVPAFTQTIMNDLTKPETKEDLKEIVKEKLDSFATKTYDNTDSATVYKIFQKYNENDREGFNQKIKKETDRLQSKAYNYTFMMIGVMVLFLLLWVLVFKKFPELRRPLFIISVILALCVLITGLLSPMIEIDARIKELDFTLLGRHIVFNDQMLFYRSKSILQVVEIMLKTHAVDSTLVGVLILAFSVLLPISKLISTEVYLLGSEKLRKNVILHWMAFKSGKWSMADVMVVAIFMSYVGFKGILDSQLDSFDIHSDTLKSISTNLTSLEPGYIIFVSFVLFSLMLSTLLKKLVPKKDE